MTAKVDYDEIAEAFDRAMPFLQPATDKLLERLPVLTGDESVLDVACGTGEPGLTLVRRWPDLNLLGIDTAPIMIEVARRKAAAEALSTARFDVMTAQDLGVDTGSIDIVVSRFGLLAITDPAAGVREVARVLRPGGSFSIAVWDAMSKNSLTYATLVALRDWLAPELLAAFDSGEQLGMPGRREHWLTEAGLTPAGSELFSWSVEFPDERSMWEFTSGPGLFEQPIASLNDEQRAQARERYSELLSHYRLKDGSYLLPHTCRLIWGSKKV